MSAVKTQSRGNHYLPGTSQAGYGQAAAQQSNSGNFSQSRFGSMANSHQVMMMGAASSLSMQQNMRRPCTLSQANHGSFFQTHHNSSSASALNNNHSQQPGVNNNFISSGSNFAFLQSSSAINSQQQDENAAPNTSTITDKEKLESMKCLKEYFSDYNYTDAQLFTALGKANWNWDKALEILFEETFNQRNSANQKKCQETNQLYQQSRQQQQQQCQQSNQHETAASSTPSFSAHYQVVKPSKRRRQQFDSQQNQQMCQQQSSPQRSSQHQQVHHQHQRPLVSSSLPTTTPSATTNSGSSSNSHQQLQPSQPQHQQPASNSSNSPSTSGSAQIDLTATRQYGSKVALQLGNLLKQPGTPDQHNSFILQALEHYADVASKQQLSVQVAQQTQAQDQLVRIQRDQSRLQHENHIMRKGFKAMLKKQSEWCKQAEKLDLMQRENERLHFELHNLRKETQPEQHSYISASMHNTHDDII